MKDGDIIIYIGNIDDNRLIHNKQYKIKFGAVENPTFWIKLNNQEHLGCDYNFVKKNFITLKEFRNLKLKKLHENTKTN